MIMEKINIAKILKDCPSGMELNCFMYEDVYFDHVDEFNIIHCYIQCEAYRTSLKFYQYGTPNSNTKAKCVIFPKGKTTWDGFQRPFKDEDILATDLGSVFFLNTRLNTDECYGCYVGIGGDGSFHICEPFAYKECCGLATEEEKQTLFQAIKDNGYKWNEETKTLEKLVKPRFKVGDRIRNNQVDLGNIYTIIEVRESLYVVNKNNEHNNYNIDFVLQDNWELAPNKFDITTLKPFESKVLVRDYDHQCWRVSFFGYFDKFMGKFDTVRGVYIQCIPYEGNEHLLGKTDDCNEYFKTWG